MGVTNRFLIDIVDSIATKINGVPADTVHRPFKTEIIKAVNEAENSIILDRPQYDFLRKTSKLKGWQKGTGQTVKQLQDANGTKSADNAPITDLTAGAVTYIAEKYIAPAGQVLTPAGLAATIYTYAEASGNLNGQFQAFICNAVTLNTADPTQDPAEKITMPDLNNIIATSNVVNVVNDLFDASAGVQFNPLPNFYVESSVKFTFPVPVPVSNQQVYWVVIKWTSQYNSEVISPYACARNMQFGVRITPDSKTSLLWTGTNYPTLASAIIGTWNMILTLDNAVFLSKNILLPADCNLALRIGQPYNGTMGGIFMLSIGTDAVMYKQFNVPPGTFCITGEDPTTGQQLCSLNTSVTIPTVGTPVTYPVVALAAEYFLDYISSGPVMALDTDTPIIPVDYRDILVYKTMVDLAALNHGLFEITAEIQQNYTYLLNKMNSKCMPQHSTAIRVNTGGFTSAMAATRDTTLSQSLLSMQWPNSWQSTFAAGQNIGPSGGY